LLSRRAAQIKYICQPQFSSLLATILILLFLEVEQTQLRLTKFAARISKFSYFLLVSGAAHQFPYLAPDLSIFFTLFEIYLVNQSLFKGKENKGLKQIIE
jgi:hypothetical protein